MNIGELTATLGVDSSGLNKAAQDFTNFGKKVTSEVNKANESMNTQKGIIEKLKEQLTSLQSKQEKAITKEGIESYNRSIERTKKLLKEYQTAGVVANNAVAESTRKSHSALENINHRMEQLTRGAAGILVVGAAIELGKKAWEGYKGIMESTDVTGDKLAVTIGKIDGALQMLKIAVVTEDMGNLWQTMKEGAKYGARLAEQLDFIGNLEKQSTITKAALSRDMIVQQGIMRSELHTIEQRAAAIKKYKQDVEELGKEEVKLANERLKAAMLRPDVAVSGLPLDQIKTFATHAEVYRNNGEAILKYIKTLKELKEAQTTTRNVGAYSGNAALMAGKDIIRPIKEIQDELNNVPEFIKALAPGYEKWVQLSEESRKSIVESIAGIDNAYAGVESANNAIIRSENNVTKRTRDGLEDFLKLIKDIKVESRKLDTSGVGLNKIGYADFNRGLLTDMTGDQTRTGASFLSYSGMGEDLEKRSTKALRAIKEETKITTEEIIRLQKEISKDDFWTDFEDGTKGIGNALQITGNSFQELSRGFDEETAKILQNMGELTGGAGNLIAGAFMGPAGIPMMISGVVSMVGGLTGMFAEENNELEIQNKRVEALHDNWEKVAKLSDEYKKSIEYTNKLQEAQTGKVDYFQNVQSAKAKQYVTVGEYSGLNFSEEQRKKLQALFGSNYSNLANRPTDASNLTAQLEVLIQTGNETYIVDEALRKIIDDYRQGTIDIISATKALENYNKEQEKQPAIAEQQWGNYVVLTKEIAAKAIKSDTKERLDAEIEALAQKTYYQKLAVDMEETNTEYANAKKLALEQDYWLAVTDMETAYYQKLADEEQQREDEIQRVQKELQDNLIGMSPEGITDILKEGILGGLPFAQSFGNTYKKILQNAIIESMSMKLIQPQIEQMAKEIGLYGQEGQYGTNGYYGAGDWNEGYSASDLKEIEQKYGANSEFQKRLKSSYDTIQTVVGEMGLTPEETNQKGLQGAIKGMSEETAGLIAGQFNGLRVSSLNIEKNTFTLFEIRDLLKNGVGTNTENALRAQGWS